MKSLNDFMWRSINKIDLFVRYINILKNLRSADIILTATSAQTNLGDHAISIAEMNFLKDSFKKLSVVEIQKEIYLKHRDVIKKKVNNNAIVVVTGGGFLGDLWMTEENLVRDILGDFYNHKIIIFPQTVFFTDNSSEYKASFNIYKKVQDLLVNARDLQSFHLLSKELSEEQICYTPDMVLSLKAKHNNKRQNIALSCIRDDKENCLSTNDINQLHLKISQRLKAVRTTTICNHVVPIAFRKFFVYKKLKEVSSSKIVITNRLHMMIFAAITGTPCIAIDNLSKKVSGVYHWIEYLPYIRLINSIEDFDMVYKVLLDLEEYKYDDSKLAYHYNSLRKQFRMEDKL